jgi:hypothetical protein
MGCGLRGGRGFQIPAGGQWPEGWERTWCSIRGKWTSLPS